jgi:hypothetical protein
MLCNLVPCFLVVCLISIVGFTLIVIILKGLCNDKGRRQDLAVPMLFNCQPVSMLCVLAGSVVSPSESSDSSSMALCAICNS